MERAAIWEINLKTAAHRIFASGLRNPNGMAWEPGTGALWTVVNERDEIGSDLVPDYLTAVQDGAFFGWPYSYYGPHVDARVTPASPDLVASAVVPDYARRDGAAFDIFAGTITQGGNVAQGGFSVHVVILKQVSLECAALRGRPPYASARPAAHSAAGRAAPGFATSRPPPT